jgi:hypothetical protein
MKVSIIVVLLVVLALGVRWLKQYLALRRTRGAQAIQANRKQASRAERDRLEIQALAMKLTAEPSAGVESPSAGAAREARGRRAAAHSAFDPDLPARGSAPDKPNPG